jgi:hypothetical protein
MKRKMFGHEETNARSGSRTFTALVEDVGHVFNHGVGVGCGR